MQHFLKLLTLITFSLVIAACSTTKPADTDTSGVDTTDTGLSAEEIARREAAEAARRAQEAEAARIAALLNSNTVYFGFDQDVIDSEYTEMLRLHAERMVRDNRSVILEGHADERGTPEYNLALGERRAKAVAQLLRTFGVSGSQIEVVSFGEESPAVAGHEESTWAKNRRVELNYK
ncbi:peptidoglycan-associated lipoprotein Pal [Kangiella sp. TOML190]|uniref:peptidoglycan-associated lipoprotein Pal n=1 Tax=Kangiella sp. TOML190 TaxID=2931351 RepID=UPI002040E099|nr:peptidoglycan-associated lipoprotein Pal [Kangiella sp. TOML190]